MAESVPITSTAPPAKRPWDARLARCLVTPLADSWVSPNHLTTVRLAVGIAGAAAFTPGTYGWTNVGAALVALSNFLDHTDGELARLSGKTSRIGHLYDLASDALVTILFFVAMGIGVAAIAGSGTVTIELPWAVSPLVLGSVAGVAVALIFLLRMRIETMAGKAGTRQAYLAGFETEDVLYLLPIVTLCGGLASFLTVASIGAPLFAIWVTIDYRRALNRHQPAATPVSQVSHAETDLLLARRLAAFDVQPLRAQFVKQGAFIAVTDVAGVEITRHLVEAVDVARRCVNRNYIPGHKRGGSVSRHSLDEIAPVIGELYRSPVLIDWLGQIAGERLQLSPDDDPHAYALYFYTNEGDHIGWHYDTSYYAGRRYTLLLGVIEQSSCRLDYELHTRESGASVESDSMQMEPGDLVFFDGDKLRHRITPLAQGELRVSLTFEYVTDPTMHPWWRLVSNMKDAIAYFGFRQVLQRVVGRARRG
jgi:phosphatidylglycerophosphate synthase